MKTKTLVVALALTLAPALSVAQGCQYGKQQAQSCAAGTIYDAESRSCVKVNA